MRNTECRNWKMASNIGKRRKCEMNNVGSGLCQVTLKNVENEKCTLQDLEYGKKTEKCGK